MLKKRVHVGSMRHVHHRCSQTSEDWLVHPAHRIGLHPDGGMPANAHLARPGPPNTDRLDLPLQQLALGREARLTVARRPTTCHHYSPKFKVGTCWRSSPWPWAFWGQLVRYEPRSTTTASLPPPSSHAVFMQGPLTVRSGKLFPRLQSVLLVLLE